MAQRVTMVSRQKDIEGLGLNKEQVATLNFLYDKWNQWDFNKVMKYVEYLVGASYSSKPKGCISKNFLTPSQKNVLLFLYNRVKLHEAIKNLMQVEIFTYLREGVKVNNDNRNYPSDWVDIHKNNTIAIKYTDTYNFKIDKSSYYSVCITAFLFFAIAPDSEHNLDELLPHIEGEHSIMDIDNSTVLYRILFDIQSWNVYRVFMNK